MSLQTRPIARVWVVTIAAIVAACGPSQTTSAAKQKLNLSARQIVGTDLVGAKGATRRDQEAIDNTAAGLCGAGTWTPSECARHDAGAK